MKKVMLQIGQLLENCNTSKFTIIGYGYIDIIVELAFDDCYQYFVARYDDNGEYEDLKRIGFSEDHKDLGNATEWKAIYDRIDKAQTEISNK